MAKNTPPAPFVFEALPVRIVNVNNRKEKHGDRLDVQACDIDLELLAVDPVIHVPFLRHVARLEEIANQGDLLGNPLNGGELDAIIRAIGVGAMRWPSLAFYNRRARLYAGKDTIAAYNPCRFVKFGLNIFPETAEQKSHWRFQLKATNLEDEAQQGRLDFAVGELVALEIGDGDSEED